jgi:hypothetical protein
VQRRGKNLEKKELSDRKTVDIRHFIASKNKSSSRLRKILEHGTDLDIPHNINKFSNNMDIIINQDQSLFLYSLWGPAFSVIICVHFF